MMIPHPEIVLGTLVERLKTEDEEITIPRELLRRLLDLYVTSWDFDEEWYLETYPDVRQGLEQTQFVSGWDHFRFVGFLEGRLGSRLVVDNDWYIQAYPDVARAMIEGKIATATEHYLQFGRAEGRLPGPPVINPKWYGPRYIPRSATKDQATCSGHFVREGYRNLAVPGPGR